MEPMSGSRCTKGLPKSSMAAAALHGGRYPSSITRDHVVLHTGKHVGGPQPHSRSRQEGAPLARKSTSASSAPHHLTQSPLSSATWHVGFFGARP